MSSSSLSGSALLSDWTGVVRGVGVAVGVVVRVWEVGGVTAG